MDEMLKRGYMKINETVIIHHYSENSEEWLKMNNTRRVSVSLLDGLYHLENLLQKYLNIPPLQKKSQYELHLFPGSYKVLVMEDCDE